MASPAPGPRIVYLTRRAAQSRMLNHVRLDPLRPLRIAGPEPHLSAHKSAVVAPMAWPLAPLAPTMALTSSTASPAPPRTKAVTPGSLYPNSASQPWSLASLAPTLYGLTGPATHQSCNTMQLIPELSLSALVSSLTGPVHTAVV